MPRHYPTVNEALKQIRSCSLERVKVAELGGDGADVPFEQAFSNLAHAYLRDKAPSLLDHELGFQLIDRNQENTKAIGVLGFKVGSHMLYAPVFFLQGDLKGHELLYIKNQDMFVPMKENWLNYILNRKPNILGESVERNTASLGVMQPDLNRLSKSPWKYASWANDVMPKLAATAFTDVSKEMQQLGEDLNLPNFVKSASLPMIDCLVKTCQRYPAFAQEIIDHHGDLEFMNAAVKYAKSRNKTASVLSPAPRSKPKRTFGSVLDEATAQHPIKRGSLEIIHNEHTEQTQPPAGLTEEDSEKLLKDHLLIKDHRNGEEVSIAYNTAVEQKLTNPGETGVYYLLVKPREFRKCYVLLHPHGPDGRKDHCTVVDLEDSGKKRWVNAHATKLWVADKIEESLQPDDYESVYNSLPDATPSNISSTGRMMLIGPRGNGTCPFVVKHTLGEQNGGGTSYEVDFDCYVKYKYESSLDYKGCDRMTMGDYEYSSYSDGQRLHLDSKHGTDIRSSRGDVWIPDTYKVLKLDLSEADKDGDDDEAPCCIHGDGSSSDEPLQPGNLIDAELAVFTKTSGVSIKRAGSHYSINDRRLSKIQSIIHLVADHGLTEKVARVILDDVPSHRTKEIRIKYAAPFQGDPYLTSGGPTAPGFPGPEMGGDNIMGWPGPTMGQSEHELAVPGMIAGDNRAAYDVRPDATGEPMDFDTIQRALSSGQKEVFDTAAIGSMLKAVRDDTMIDRYLPDLVKGMDRLGRILFMFYWHSDKFADRYGKQDMPELEDSLRNAFEQVGDVILFLKQKTIEPYPEEDAVDLEIGSEF
jgi:hypothetical protein